MFNFGNIFIYEGNEYVWLHSDGKTIFAAKIIDNATLKNLKAIEKGAGRKPGSGSDNVLYCYVELTTDQYSESGAHLASATQPIAMTNPSLTWTEMTLSADDLHNIKCEILDSKELFRKTLTEYVESIFEEDACE